MSSIQHLESGVYVFYSPNSIQAVHFPDTTCDRNQFINTYLSIIIFACIRIMVEHLSSLSISQAGVDK